MKAISKCRWAAYHEAGHAVVRFVRTGKVTAIDTEEDGSGFSHGTGEKIRTSDKIEIALGGPIAEARQRKISLFLVLVTNGAEDWESAKSDASTLASSLYSDTDSILNSAETNARQIIREYWQSVERLAQMTIANGSLPMTAVAEILTETTVNNPIL